MEALTAGSNSRNPMQNLGEAAVLAAVQGITEFLPVSSSAHLALTEELLGWQDHGVGFEIAVHAGTLLAVVVYFRRDLAALLAGVRQWFQGKPSPEGRLALALAVASLPLLPAGWLLLHTDWRLLFHAVEPIAWVNLAFALLLYLADRRPPQTRPGEHPTLPHALAIGIAQTLALIPGASRAGVAITMSRALGYSRLQAARFSMLLAIPAILASTAALFTGPMPSPDAILILVFAACFAFVAASAVIAWFLRMMIRTSLLVFVLYRVGLSLILLGWIYL